MAGKANAVVGQSGGPTGVINASLVGVIEEAKKHLEINIKLSGELGDEKEAMRASLSLGYIFIQEGNYKQAENILNDAYATITRLKLTRDEVICLTFKKKE